MDFVVKLSELEARIVECVGNLIDKEGFELVKIRAVSEAGQGHLTFFMDKKGDGSITLDDLTYLNGLLSDVLDVADAQKPLFKKSYKLEVSSPGVERPLTKKSHFEAAVQKNIKVRTDGLAGLAKSVTGIVKGVDEAGIQLETDKNTKMVVVPFAHMKEAYEVFDFAALEPKKGKKSPGNKIKGDK